MAYNNIFDTTSYVRKCTLMTNPTTNRINGAPTALGSDNRGSQINIDLSYLPPGVVLSQIKQGQKWWVEKRTTAWVLYLYVGEFNPYSYALFNSTKDWVPSSTALTYTPIIYDKVINSVASSMGSIISDPTTGLVSVPIPGLYDVTVSARTTAAGRFNSTSGYYGSFYDDTNQTAAAANTAYTMQIGHTDPTSNGVSISSGQKILFSSPGTYNLQFSAQFINTDTSASASREVTIWLRNSNDSSGDIAYSSGVFSVPNRHTGNDGSIIASWNYIINVSAGDFIRLMWSTTNTSISLATTTPAIGPISPAVIVTVQEAGAYQGANGQIGLQLLQPNSKTAINGPWSSPSTGTDTDDAIPVVQQNATLALTKENLSFYSQAAWGGHSTDISVNDPSNTYLIVAYRGPVN